jgi:hypothetical protein
VRGPALAVACAGALHPKSWHRPTYGLDSVRDPKLTELVRRYFYEDSGVFECRDCSARYDIQDAHEDELICSECDGTLALAEAQDTDEQNDE